MCYQRNLFELSSDSMILDLFRDFLVTPSDEFCR